LSSSFYAPPPPQLCSLSLHDALPISSVFQLPTLASVNALVYPAPEGGNVERACCGRTRQVQKDMRSRRQHARSTLPPSGAGYTRDRKSTRLNSSHVANSYAVFRLKTK